jgi:hypothetical protein
VKFGHAELIRFLHAIDAHLAGPGPFIMVIIGGAAAALAYRASLATLDIDTINSLANMGHAIDKAREVTGLPIPVRQTGVFDPPADYEERLYRLALPGLHRLQVVVPDRYDLVLMKTARALQHDIDHIAQIHAHQPLELQELVERFKTMVAVGQPEVMKGNLLAVVARLYGDAAAEELERSS